jgi:hypothetical protein
MGTAAQPPTAIDADVVKLNGVAINIAGLNNGDDDPDLDGLGGDDNDLGDFVDEEGMDVTDERWVQWQEQYQWRH